MSSVNYVTVQFHIFESTCMMFNCKIPLIPANYLFCIFPYIEHTEKKFLSPSLPYEIQVLSLGFLAS